jgi:predicted PurR-regulated permease PerM
MDRPLFYTLTAFSLLALMLYLVYAVVAPFLASLCWAGVIGILTFPVYRRMRSRLYGRENVAAGVMTIVVVLLLVLPVVGLTFFIAKEAAIVYGFLERVTADGGQQVVDNITSHPLLKPWLNRLESYVGPLDFSFDTTVFPEMKQVATAILNYSKALVKNVFIIFIKLILIVIALFFIYRDGERFRQQLLSVIPLNDTHKQMLVDTVERVLMAVVYGVFLTCLVQGTLGGLGFWVTGLPSPVLFGAMMSVSALIPVVGTALFWLPGAAYLLMTGDVVQGAGLIVWGFAAVSSIDNIIRPFFISGKAKLPILVVAVGGLGGLVTFGVIGVVVGPLLLALFLAIFDIYRHDVEEDGIP